MKQLARLTLILLCFALPARAFAMAAVVDVAWVEENLGKPGIVFLDIQPNPQYQRFHVPGAVNAPYDKWRTAGKKPGEARGMMPSVEYLESLIGNLGIDNQTSVVVIPTGTSAGDLAAAARVFWTFKVLGHGPVAILDGGLLAYAKAGKSPGRLESGANRSEPKTFNAQPDERLVVTAEGTRSALESGAEMVDARSAGEFVGVYVGGDGERAGTIPGAKNLPYDWVSDQGSGKLRDLTSLKRLYSELGVSERGEQVHFCHTGNRAALTWFVSYALFGNEKAQLYDASMLEWARRPELPMEQKIKLCEAC